MPEPLPVALDAALAVLGLALVTFGNSLRRDALVYDDVDQHLTATLAMAAGGWLLLHTS